MSDPTVRLAITSLAQIEDKLRRALNLAGEVGLTFAPAAIPVVIAGNATDPGCATYRGRRFAGTKAPAASGAAASVALKAQENVVITQIAIHAAAAGVLGFVRLASTDVAEPYAMATPFAPWTERKGPASDYAPVTTSVFWAADSTAGELVATTSLAVGRNNMLEQPLMLTPGQFVIIRVSGAVTAGFTFSGYVF